MLVISGGMPKSGSTYMFHLLNGLAAAGGYPDSLVSTKKYPLEDFVRPPNNFVEGLSLQRLIKLWIIAAKEGRFLIKTHELPGSATKLLIRCGGARLVYIYRDPRDCLLSALDYGAKVRARGVGPAYFAKLETFDEAFREVKKWVAIWKAYQKAPGILIVRYEDLLSMPEVALERCAKYLKLHVDPDERRKVLWDYSSDNPNVRKIRMPLNKAVAHRYRTEMPRDQQERFRDELGEIILSMGFALD